MLVCGLLHSLFVNDTFVSSSPHLSLMADGGESFDWVRCYEVTLGA